MLNQKKKNIKIVRLWITSNFFFKLIFMKSLWQPSEGNRVLVRPYEEEESIRDDERSFRDINYSVTGLDSNGGVVTVLNGFPLHLTSDGCKIRSNWNFAYCNHAYGSVSINVHCKYLTGKPLIIMYIRSVLTSQQNYQKTYLFWQFYHAAPALKLFYQSQLR